MDWRDRKRITSGGYDRKFAESYAFKYASRMAAASAGAVPDVMPPPDGSSLILNPTLATHYRAMGIPIPGHAFRCQDDGVANSGGLIDIVRGAILAKVGTGHLYQQASADVAGGYATQVVKLVDGTASMGWQAASGALWDPLHSKIKLCGSFEPVLPGGTRTLFAMTGAASAAFQILSSTGIKLRVTIAGGSSPSGTFAYTAGTRYPFVFTMFSNTISGSGIVRVLTNKEFFTATWAGQADNTKGIGPAGSASLTASASGLARLDIYMGAAAEYIENLGGGGAQGDKAYLQAWGWSGFTF